MKTKILAYYLPQFHAIPENDEWWGKGFTEWTNVKKSKPLFKGHYQPRIPLDNNYYDLSCVETMAWQANLASENGVDGFVFYHYWFNGKLLLEKPLQNLLDTPEINMPFCLSWANEPWTRAWDGKTKDILIEQKYGAIAEWEEHFEYLLKAFKDRRYIKTESGLPILLIYRAENICNFDEMISYWRKRILEEGFKGLHVVATNTGFIDEFSVSNYDKRVDFEPFATFSRNRTVINRLKSGFKTRAFKVINKYSRTSVHYSTQEYSEVWGYIINKKNDEHSYPGAFVDWDNSARKGFKGMVFNGFSSEKFGTYFSAQYEKALKNKQEFLFINAWNEWAEGTYLEPDEKNGLTVLDSIKKVKGL